MSCPFAVHYFDKEDKCVGRILSNCGWIPPTSKELANFMMFLPWFVGTEYIKFLGYTFDKKYLKSSYFMDDMRGTDEAWKEFFSTPRTKKFTETDIQLRDVLIQKIDEFDREYRKKQKEKREQQEKEKEKDHERQT